MLSNRVRELEDQMDSDQQKVEQLSKEKSRMLYFFSNDLLSKCDFN